MESQKTSKVQYTENEAAVLLGISVERLRALVRHHIVKEERESSNLAYATFQPSDLLVLKILAGMMPEQPPAPPLTPSGF
jgi:hypothetical protein